jgi:hypothetical protein
MTSESSVVLLVVASMPNSSLSKHVRKFKIKMVGFWEPNLTIFNFNIYPRKRKGKKDVQNWVDTSCLTHEVTLISIHGNSNAKMQSISNFNGRGSACKRIPFPWLPS